MSMFTKCSALGVLLVLAGMGAWGLADQEKKNGLTIGIPAAVAPECPGGSQRWPDVAWGRDGYLVVWQEGAAYEGPTDANIMAARVSADGKPLDPQGIVVCKAKHHQIYPKVCFDGTSFLVAWQDYRSGRDWDVYATRLSPAGQVLDPDGFPLADGPGNQVHPTLASNGSDTLIVWSDLRPNLTAPERYVLAGTFWRQGKLENHNGSVLSENGKNGSLLGGVVRWDGNAFIVAAQAHPSGWQYGLPWSIRVQPGGRVESLNFPFFGHSYALASDPQRQCTLIWSYQQYGHGSYNCAFQVAIYPTGQRFGVVGMPQHYSPANELWAAATYDGRHFIVVSERATEVTGSRNYCEVDLVATRVDPDSAHPLDFGHVPFDGKDARALADPVGRARSGSPTGITVAAESGIPERHPALASSKNGRSLLVYSRHAGPGSFRICCVPLSE